jgi:hypothetical protein
MYCFDVKFRLAGRVSFIRVTARDAAHARALVRADYGNAVTVLQTKRLR